MAWNEAKISISAKETALRDTSSSIMPSVRNRPQGTDFLPGYASVVLPGYASVVHAGVSMKWLSGRSIEVNKVSAADCPQLPST